MSARADALDGTPTARAFVSAEWPWLLPRYRGA